MLEKHTQPECRHEKTPEPRLEREGHITHIYKPEGTYTILYGRHNDYEENPKNLPDDLKGLFLEHISDYPNHPLESFEYVRTAEQFRSLINTLEEKLIPAYLFDLDIKDQTNINLFQLDQAVPIIEAAAGGLLAFELCKELSSPRLISRRHFLGRIRDLTKLTGAAYLTSPMLSVWVRAMSQNADAGHDLTAKIQKTSSKIHPEVYFIICTLREMIMAQKEEWLMKKIGSKPHFATAIGVMHASLEDKILYGSEKRLEFLEKIKNFLGFVSPKNFYQIVGFEYDGQAWKVGDIFEVPELKEIIEGAK